MIGAKSEPSRKAKVTAEHKAEAEKLRALWTAKENRETQQVFGETYGVGNQSAVGQFLRGEVPLSMGAAKGFARGLGCQIAAFSPRLAAEAAEIAAVTKPKPAKTMLMSILDLDKPETQLIGLYRELTPEQQARVQELANQLHNEAHPHPSAANPYAGVPKGSKKTKKQDA